MAKIAIYNITNTLKRGGVETCLWEVARKFRAWGHQVTVMGGQGTVRPSGGIEGIEVKTFDFTPRERMPNLGSRFKKLGERLSFARSALPALLEGDFDAMVLGKPYDIPAALWARRKRGTRVAYFSGGGEYFPGYGLLARRLDYFCACSAHDAREIFAFCGVLPDVNTYGVDTEVFRPLPPDAELAARLGIQAGDRVMASGVRLVAFKGLDVGLKALAILRTDLPRLKYVIAGEGPERERLGRLARELGLEDAVILAGEMDHAGLARLYSLAEVAVFPSFMETFGVAVGEAMACGVAVAASEVGGIPEQVAPGTGVLVPPRDPEELARAVGGLLADPGREIMGRAAREHALNHLDWSRCAQRLLEGLLPGAVRAA